MPLCSNCKCELKEHCSCEECMEPFRMANMCHVCTVMYRVVNRSEGLRKAQQEYEEKLKKRKDTSGL
jgi:hypothetical protein